MKFARTAVLVAALVVAVSCEKEEDQTITINFEDVVLPEEGFLGAEDAEGAHEINNVSFMAMYNAEYGSSSGVIISSLTDTETAGFVNSYSAYAGSGANGSSKFAVINPPWGNTEPIITFDGPVTVESVEVTNTTYTALSMRDGDAFAKKFTAEDEDFFSVNFEGFDAGGNSAGTVTFYLADFRMGSNTGIVDSWQAVDLSSLGPVSSIGVTFESSDVGTYGINTPLYVAVDNISFVE